MRKLFVLALLLNASLLSAQTIGDSLFATDQVLRFELTFNQTGYWDSLVNEYNGTQEYIKADLVITTNQGTRSFADVGVRFKGNSTYNHPNNKKPFKIDMNKFVVGQDFDGLKKFNLSNGFKDPSMMREKIFFDLCRETGILAPRANFVDLYINGELWGFYTLVEQVDDQFLDWAIGDDNGNLFKAGDNFGGPGGGGVPADLVYYGTAQTSYADRYELKTNETANDWTDLIELIDFLNNSSDVDFGNQVGDHLITEDLIRSIALDNLFSNLDSYTGSARNYYLYHNMTTNKWEWVKWDANEAFGSYTNGQNTLTLNVEYHNTDRPLIERIFNNQVLLTDYKNDICYLIENYFNNAHLDPVIDAHYALIQSHVYADSKKMYSNTQFDQSIDTDITSGGGPGGGTIYGLKSFIDSRIVSVTGQVDCNYYNGVNEIESGEINLFPNPASDQVKLVWDDLVENAELVIYNQNGQIVEQLELSTSGQMTISLNSYDAGIYHLRIAGTNFVSDQKLVVLK